MAYTLPPKEDRSSSYSSPNSSNRSYFTEQAIPPGFSGRTDSREIELKWENERGRIRAEILKKEMARRQFLEEEIRLELKLEREAAIQRWEASTMRVDPLRTCQQLIGHCEERVVPSRTVVRVENSPTSGTPHTDEERRLQLPPMVPGHPVVGVGGYQQHPMPVATSSLGLSQIKPLSEPPKETINVSLQAKLEANVSGLNRKRKASTLGADRPGPGGSNLEKRPKGWTCKLCKVSTSNLEKSINEHLKGKKHKRKEEATR